MRSVCVENGALVKANLLRQVQGPAQASGVSLQTACQEMQAEEMRQVQQNPGGQSCVLGVEGHQLRVIEAAGMYAPLRCLECAAEPCPFID